MTPARMAGPAGRWGSVDGSIATLGTGCCLIESCLHHLPAGTVDTLLILSGLRCPEKNVGHDEN